MLALGLKVREQPPVRLVRGADLQQLVGPLVQVDDPQAELLGVDYVLIVLITKASASLRIRLAACGTRACPATESAISSPVRRSRWAWQV